jgi:hypothetical protein
MTEAFAFVDRAAKQLKPSTLAFWRKEARFCWNEGLSNSEVGIRTDWPGNSQTSAPDAASTAWEEGDASNTSNKSLLASL